MLPASLNGDTKTDKFKLTISNILLVPVLTTSERNKLKIEKGLVVFNSSLSKLQVHNGTDWVSTH